ncbi:MAG: hypothetical protein IPJ82_24940 [Lewinellaceae bacterium]|nr:hypothetical protein [Lewinellaceae bacterium]
MKAPPTQQFTSGFINADFNYAATYGLQPRQEIFPKNDHNPDWDKLESIVLAESGGENVRLYL